MATTLIQFDQFELDLGRYELRRAGRVLKLEKIPMELLILLAGKQGQLVTRQEIIEKLWGSDVFSTDQVAASGVDVIDTGKTSRPNFPLPAWGEIVYSG
jgi:DNA-binding winged helix-turn-helix (wHTH) protein